MFKNRFLFSVGLTLLIIVIDQWVKFHIKTHFFIGEEIKVAGNWFRIHFTENYGMAFGLEFGGKSGKILLTVFRILAVVVGGWYIHWQVKKKMPVGYVLAWTLIWAGAIGNIIDSVFYGVWFGYDTWFQGRVVDMFYFPLIQTTLPESFPIWSGQDFEFFRPVFNVADASISTGFMIILVFQKKFLAKKVPGEVHKQEEMALSQEENP